MKFVRVLSMAGLIVCSGAAAALGAEPEVKLEGTGPNRERLDAMSFKPFDASLLGNLSQWSGTAPTADAMKGKVVVFVTWASWYKTSLEAMKIAQGLHEKNADKGLVVVGVHSSKGFEKAADTAKTVGIAFPYAMDTQDGFRKALYSTQEPDFYILDRAGNLRYADVVTSSVEAAVEQLLAETAESAATAKPGTKPADAPEAVAKEGEGVPANFQMPDAAAYKAAKWPKHNPKEQLSAGDFQGKPLPKPLGKEKFVSKEKPDRTGKVTVLDFWATWCGPCKMAMPKLDKLQKDNLKDVVVIGISDESESTIKAFLSKNKHGYAQAVDPSHTVNGALKIEGIPHVVVLSSDGVIRWQGNPLQGDFEQAVKAVVDADPGVKARREAQGGK